MTLEVQRNPPEREQHREDECIRRDLQIEVH